MCFEFIYERLFTNESVSRRLEIASENNTSQISKRMDGLVEMNSHRETPAVVSDALYKIIKIIYFFIIIVHILSQVTHLTLHPSSPDV